MNSENSRSSKPHVFVYLILLIQQIYEGVKKVLLIKFQYLLYMEKNMKNSCNNNKFKTSAPIWNDKFELPDRSYSVSDIQD